MDGPPFAADSHQPALWHLDAARGPSTPSLDDLIDNGIEALRHTDSKRCSGLHVDGQIVFGRCLDRQVRGFLSLKDTIDVTRCAPVRLNGIWPIRHETAALNEIAKRIDRGQLLAGCQPDNVVSMHGGRGTPGHYQAAVRRSCELHDGYFNFADVANSSRYRFDPDRLCCRLNCAKLTYTGGIEIT